ncbi:multidrug and toxin extrusion protein 1-like [Salarias fasciatus]|uniref:multidrug and toxin extrusion protein 1-like n=1 Tax=Salarias fasciatus TaxID=181472 RepID=UPI001176BF1F|nr:multidrug and toxin extrusion protein 1-like [Salarias fasciatus]
MARPSDKVFCCRWVRKRVPDTHREELFHILRMTGPLLLSRIFNYLLPFVVTMFCGRLGNDVMAGYGLASAAINVSTAATGTGLGLACDTLVSQTFGGKNLLRVGVILQRGIIILLLFCLPCWGLLINAQPILLYLGQDPEVARIAQLYITAFLPAVPAMFLHGLQVSYLQNQGIILPQMYTAVLANIANVVTNYVFLYWLDLGVSGSAAANTLSWIYICAFLFAYIWWKKLHVTTWGGWSAESLQEWGSYMKLAIPSTMMTCFEWWVYEFGGFFAGMMSEAELAAQHAVIMIAFITYMFPLGIQAAACARVGNALGAGDTARALLTTKLSLGLACGFAAVEGLVLGSTKTVIGYLFTSDEEIVGLVSHLMNAYCALQLFDGLVCVCTGIFLGTGKQKIPAVANFVGYYGIGLSLAVVLMFVAKMRILGFWLGLLTATFIQSSFYSALIIFKLDWKRMTEEAVKRAQKKTHLTLFGSDSPTDASTDLTASNGNSADGYVSVSTEGGDGSAEAQEGAAAPQPKKRSLSTMQLLVRRGLTVCAAVALLAVGICVHVAVPLPTHPSANITVNQSHAEQILSTVLVPVNAAA